MSEQHINRPMGEDGAEVPRDVDAVIAMLLGRLASASADTGRAFYADFYPIDPENPGDYAVEVSISPVTHND
jgi:hypothetical protein